MSTQSPDEPGPSKSEHSDTSCFSSATSYASPLPSSNDYTNMFANPPYGAKSNRTRTSSNASFIESTSWGFPSRSPTSATSTMAYTWSSNDKNETPAIPAYMNAVPYPMTGLHVSFADDPVVTALLEHETVGSVPSTETGNDAPPLAKVQKTAGSEIPSKDAVQTDVNALPQSEEFTSWGSEGTATSSSYQDACVSSDASPNADTAFSSQKEQILERLMIRFYEMFDASTGFSSRTTSESASPNTSTRETTRSRDGLSDARQGKRKRGDDDDDEKEDNGRGKRTKKVEVPTSTPEKEKKRLACHYFKHDPRKYRDTRTCGGPGWETIHRVKEHLYRRHSVLPQCARCGENFPDAARLNEHLRNADACTICEVVPNEGIDKIKEEKLKNRRAVFQAGNEEEKWRDVYLILFPEADSSKIPSPYYHDDEPTNDDSPKAIEAERLQEYLSQTLPTIVRHELRRAIDAALAPIEENLTSRLETIVRDCQENATRTFLQNFQPYPSQSSMTYPPIAETYPFNAETQYPLGTQSSQETSVSRTPDALAAYAVPPESTFHSWPEPALGGQSFFAPATAPSDSAYHSDMSRAYQYLPNWNDG